jgi:hypothetical protein
MAIKSEWIVASTTARNALTVTDADVQLGAECKVLADGAIYRAVRSGSGATMWAASDAESEFNASEIGGVLVGTDVLTMSRGGAIYTMLMSRIATYIGTALNITSGTWTPTATITLNADSVTPSSECSYIRVGTTVFFSIRVAVDATATGAVGFRLTLPIASAFSAANQAQGTVGGATLAAGVNFVQADATNDALDCSLSTSSTAAQTFTFVGQYRVI